MSFGSAVALASFAHLFGDARPVPPGPRRDRLVRELDLQSGELLLQSDASYMDPAVGVATMYGKCRVDQRTV